MSRIFDDPAARHAAGIVVPGSYFRPMQPDINRSPLPHSLTIAAPRTRGAAAALAVIALVLTTLCGCGGAAPDTRDAVGAFNALGGAHRANDFTRTEPGTEPNLTSTSYPSLAGGLLAPPLELPGRRMAVIARSDTTATLAVLVRDSVLWHYRFEPGRSPMPGLAADSSGTLYAITTDGTLYAFSDGGRVRWRQTAFRPDTAAHAIVVPAPLLALADGVVAAASDGEVVRIARSGAHLWSVTRGASAAGTIAADPTLGLVLAVTHDDYRMSDTLVALDPATGRERWARPLAARAVRGPAIVGAHVMMGLAQRDTAQLLKPVLAAYSFDGREAWRRPLLLMPRGISGDGQGNLYVACSGIGTEAMGGAVISFDSSGGRRWQALFRSGVPDAPAVTAKALFFVARRDGRTGLYSYDNDGTYRHFESIDVLPDVLAQTMVASSGELMLAGLNRAALLRPR